MFLSLSYFSSPRQAKYHDAPVVNHRKLNNNHMLCVRRRCTTPLYVEAHDEVTGAEVSNDHVLIIMCVCYCNKVQ